MDDENKKLTLKQRKWIKAYLETGNATEAAMQVYDCKDRDSAAIIGFENVRKLNFDELMEEAGITDKKLNDKLSEGLDSTKVNNSPTEPDKVVADFPTRHKYLETALKLKKRLIERADITSDGERILDVSATLTKIYGQAGNGGTGEMPSNS